MVEISQRDVWWADLETPTGSALGFRRPVVVIQSDSFNHSRISTVVCIPLTSNLAWTRAPGNVTIPAKASGLSKESVANVSQIVTLDRSTLTDKAGKLNSRLLQLILAGVDIVLGR